MLVMELLEVVEGRDWLGFAGIARPSLYMIPREQQFAEKLHAYTLPRKGAVNSRVRDLVDMVLLIRSATMARNKVTEAIRVTFERRKTHSLPSTLPVPLLSGRTRTARLRASAICQGNWRRRLLSCNIRGTQSWSNVPIWRLLGCLVATLRSWRQKVI